MKAATSPSPVALLKERLARLDQMEARLAEIRSEDPDVQMRKQEGHRRITDARAACQRELQLRSDFEKLQAASADDKKDPGPEHRGAWIERERQRELNRTQLRKEFQELRASQAVSSRTNPVGKPVTPCDRRQEAKTHSSHGVSHADGGGSFKTASPATTDWAQDPPKEINRLVGVEILDGIENNCIVQGTGIQWVNLPQFRDKYPLKLPEWLKSIDGRPVTSSDRLGPRVRVRVRFDKPRSEHFMLSMVATSVIQKYSAEERKHSAYTVSPAKKDASPDIVEGVTDADGTAIVDVFHLTAAGGDCWSFSARDDYGNCISSSGRLEAHRGLFIVPMVMKNIRSVDLTQMRSSFDREFLHLQVLPELRTEPYRRHLVVTTRYSADARPAYQTAHTPVGPLSDLEPYLICCGFYDMSPRSGVLDIEQRFEVMPDAHELRIPVLNEKGKQCLLWHNVEDMPGDWLLSITLEVVDGAGNARPIAVARNAVKAEGNDDSGYPAALINLRALKLPQQRLSLRVEIRTKVISGGINGFSAGAQGHGSLIAVCTRSPWYEERAHTEIAKTLVHEVGHKINLVSSGDNVWTDPKGYEWGGRINSRYLDAVKSQYFGKGHQGSHCNTGASEAAENEGMVGKQGTCVMFGEGWPGRNGTFCGECLKSLRKIDVAGGWKSF